ncbi:MULTISPECIES: GNAT family N-acetyltransferase [Kordiimonas]|uniref:GNAT family N-acetyltransferase n=1 Tax=Kordiimonas TaxID=288021 RepID=UPI00257AC611|nr:GNAT family N-acetyltransferase [Kordiimonas sp. UBA4487]
MLTTDRLILRPWVDADREPFAAINACADVMRYFPSVQTRAQSDATVDRQMKAQADRGYCFWAAEKRDDGQFIGFIGIQDVPDYYGMKGGIEIGWRLAASTWGQGLAPEGARACLAYAFSKLGAPEVVAFTAKVNKPSMRVMEKIGMTRDLAGDFDHPMIDEGHPIRPHVLYRIKADAVLSC